MKNRPLARNRPRRSPKGRFFGFFEVGSSKRKYEKNQEDSPNFSLAWQRESGGEDRPFALENESKNAEIKTQSEKWEYGKAPAKRAAFVSSIKRKWSPSRSSDEPELGD
jgi:hypothetical protein